MVRLVLGIIAGIVAAFATIWAVDLVGQLLKPIPSGLDIYDYQAVRAYIKTMPPWSLALVALAWLLGALVGGLVAGTITRRPWAVMLIGLLVILGGVANVMMIPHPVVLQIAAVVAPALGTLIAIRILRRRGGFARPARETAM
ncbi:MAG TPA: hypothetical protein VHM92_03040 [Allosphingosinicella sp.]|nr:hypothetical protein [Allosphingosinicella sp.]